MLDERLRVLKMLEAGQITADEAAKLLDALQASPRPSQASAGRMLRVRVTEIATGRVQASMNVPLVLAQTFARAGMRLGGIWAPRIGGLDLPNVLDAIESGEPGRVVEWADHDNGRLTQVVIE